MNQLLYIIFTHNRSNILNNSLNTLFKNNDIKPDRVLIIDDGSTKELKTNLFNYCLNHSVEIPMDLYSINKNIGYGAAAEFAIRLAIAYNYKYTFFIESDYIFSKHGLDTVLDIFENNEFGQNAIGFSGYDNPDFYIEEKTEKIFKEIIITDCGEDNLNRDIMYKPFEINTKYGNKKLEIVSNSCGTMYFNWEKMMKLREEFPLDFEKWINRTTDKNKQKRLLNDGMMSHGAAWLWAKWAKKNNINTDKYGALLNIKPSVANHINGGGINGYIVEEGQTFTSSPTFEL